MRALWPAETFELPLPRHWLGKKGLANAVAIGAQQDTAHTYPAQASTEVTRIFHTSKLLILIKSMAATLRQRSLRNWADRMQYEAALDRLSHTIYELSENCWTS